MISPSCAHCTWRLRRTSSRACPTGRPRSSSRRPGTSPAASGSASASPAPCSPILRCSSLPSPRWRSTRAPRRRSRPDSATVAAVARLVGRPARRPGHRAGHHPTPPRRRTGPAARPGPCHPRRPAHRRTGRGHGDARPDYLASCRTFPLRRSRGPHRAGRRPPAAHRSRRRPGGRDGGRQSPGSRHARRSSTTAVSRPGRSSVR